ncbi:MAG: transmission trait enhancer LetE [Legionella sp. 40-6]|nr:transmission trait enhancer LetE [Legionella sp.]OJY37005.1 MAG: transmission trait enhancer LetE [Legionella sp. 40-6]
MNDINAILPDIRLRFNIEHPSYEESYTMGYESALAQAAEEDNPFAFGTPEAEQWLEGWWDALSGDEPLFDLKLQQETHEVELIEEMAANDQQFFKKHGFLSLVIEISGAIAASALVGYQLFELVA